MLSILNLYASLSTQMVCRTVSKINRLNFSIEKQLMETITEIISPDSKFTPHTAMIIMVIQK